MLSQHRQDILLMVSKHSHIIIISQTLHHLQMLHLLLMRSLAPQQLGQLDLSLPDV